MFTKVVAVKDETRDLSLFHLLHFAYHVQCVRHKEENNAGNDV
jgi:hypothetical protein